MDPVLSIINVNKKFDGTVALDDFSLGVPRDSITAIIGPNGSGKSTALKSIFGLISVWKGKVGNFYDELYSQD